MPDDERGVESEATYLHEWAHYVQFSATPVGILLSCFRRRCFATLVDAIVASPHAGRGAALDVYLEGLERFNLNWRTWRDDWYVVKNLDRRSVASVRLELDQMVVELDGLDGVFTLPIGPAQIFEAWAWLVEQQYRVLEGAEFRFTRDPRQLIYTWPLFALADRQGIPVEQLDLISALSQLLPYLFVSCFYDGTALSSDGKGVRPAFKTMVDELGARGVTSGRVFWQLLRDRPLTGREKPGAVCPALDEFLGRSGLPALNAMLDQTKMFVATLAEAFEQALGETVAKALEQGGLPELYMTHAEIDLLNTSARNLEVIEQHIEVALMAPVYLRWKVEPAVCAYDNGDHYVWSVNAYRRLTEEEMIVFEVRSKLRQQLAIYEHIVEQYVAGAHLGCYGSPEWAVPINACPVAAECLARTARRGIEFCVDPDWRIKVVEVLSAITGESNDQITDHLVPGFAAALGEYIEIFRDDAINDARLLDTRLLGLRIPGLTDASE
jgi:hypothetical protein